MKTVSFITIFKEPFLAFFNTSLMAKAQKNNLIKINIASLLDEVNGDYHKIDDSPYGGSPGELIRVDVVHRALKKLIHFTNPVNRRIILTDPAGKPFDQKAAHRLKDYDELIFICGRYEGIDARIYNFIDESLSLGDFVLSSGDLAAMAMADSIIRLQSGFMHNHNSIINESHEEGRLEGSHYTRPEEYEGYKIPAVLKNGNHKEIHKWRKLESLCRTKAIRPDLLEKIPLLEEEKKLLKNDQLEKYPWQKIYD